MWHPGADSATTISFSRDVSIAGHDLAAGRYTLWTIPAEPPQPWTVIFSRALGVWHTPYPGEASDVLRVTVSPTNPNPGNPVSVTAQIFNTANVARTVLAHIEILDQSRPH